MNSKLLNRACQILKQKGSLSCSELGWLLWGDSTPFPSKGKGVHLNNKFCRPAGKVLNALFEQGRAKATICQKKYLWSFVETNPQEDGDAVYENIEYR